MLNYVPHAQVLTMALSPESLPQVTARMWNHIKKNSALQKWVVNWGALLQLKQHLPVTRIKIIHCNWYRSSLSVGDVGFWTSNKALPEKVIMRLCWRLLNNNILHNTIFIILCCYAHQQLSYWSRFVTSLPEAPFRPLVDYSAVLHQTLLQHRCTGWGPFSLRMCNCKSNCIPPVNTKKPS